MKQKVTVNEAPASFMYPYIGVYDGIVVFFSGPGTGVCLTPSDSSNRAGEYSASWKEVEFTPLNGSITMEQEA